MRTLLLAGVVAIGWIGSAQASLIGTSVTGSLSAVNDTTITQQFSPSIVVVGPGVEFQGSLKENYFNQPFNISVDLGASNIVIGITGGANYNAARSDNTDLAKVVLSNLSSSVTGISLTSYTCTGNVACGSSSIFDNTSSFIFSNSILTIGYENFIVGQTYIYAVQEAATSVPEPASMTLLGVGALGTLAMVGRRRRGVGAILPEAPMTSSADG